MATMATAMVSPSGLAGANVFVTTPEALHDISFDPKLKDVGENLMNIDHYRPATQRHVNTLEWIRQATRELVRGIGAPVTRELAALWQPVLLHMHVNREVERCEKAFLGHRSNLQVLIEASEPHRARELALQRDRAADDMLRCLGESQAYLNTCLRVVDEHVSACQRAHDELNATRDAIEREHGRFGAIIANYVPTAEADVAHWTAWGARVREVLDEERARVVGDAIARAKHSTHPDGALRRLPATVPTRPDLRGAPIAIQHIFDACMRSFETRAICQMIEAFERCERLVGRCACGASACTPGSCGQ